MTAQFASVDWSTSYARFLAQSAEVSARTLRLYQEALDLVSSGKLPATIFQDHLPRFAQTHSGEFTLQLAEAGARFMTDLMQVSTRFGQAANPDIDEPDLIPPHFDARNPLAWYEQLGQYAGQLNARAMRIYRAQLDRVASGETTPSEVQQSASDKLARGIPEYLQRLTAIYFDLLNGLNDVRARYEEAYFRGVLAQARDENTDSSIVLRLFGACGTTVSGSLSVVNTTPRPASITWRVSELRRADGVGRAFEPKVVVVPEPLQLDAGAEATVTIAVQLESQTYDANVPYVGSFHIMGGPDLQVEVQLQITASATAPNGADPTSRP